MHGVVTAVSLPFELKVQSIENKPMPSNFSLANPYSVSNIFLPRTPLSHVLEGMRSKDDGL